MPSEELEGRDALGVFGLNGTADAARYLEEKLSGPVRNSIAAVLHDRPQDPLRYIAIALRDHQHQPQQQPPKRSPETAAFPADPVPLQRAQSTAKVVVEAPQSGLGRAPREDPQRDCAHAPSPTQVSPHVPTTAQQTRTALPLVLSLEGGRSYHVRPFSVDFTLTNARHRSSSGSDSAGSQPPPSFPSVLYREAATTFEVGSCLRRLQQLAPQAPLLLFVESPSPLANVFFYESVPYACAARGVATTADPKKDIADDVAVALQQFGGTVQSFNAALSATAADAAPTASVVFLPALQTNFLAALDMMSTALDDAYLKSWKRVQAPTAGAQASSPLQANVLLPAVLLVSYRAESARLTHARLLAAYGPFYEAAQRVALQNLRLGQLERKKKFTFGFAMEYWTQVQRRRETASTNTTAANTSAVAAAAVRPATTTPAENAGVQAADGNGVVSSVSGMVQNAATTAAAAAAAANGGNSREGSVSASTVKDLAKTKRVSARSEKRGLPAYDAHQQAEDDVFLVVLRRMEHAAATLIQSVYRGHRARVRYQRARTPCGAVGDSKTELKGGGVCVSSVVKALPPLLEASLARMREEGRGFHDIWKDIDPSPPPECRRYWIYRPVQRTVKANPPSAEASGAVVGMGDAAKINTAATSTSRVREDWVQEELLIPPVRATQPRVHLNLAQRLLDYLAVAQCTILPDAMQLFADTPGLSVLQRRAYDQVKSLCLTLFYVGYGELRQRYRASVPATFSQYMRANHATVLTWFQFPHDTSLLLRAVSEAGGGGDNDAGRRAVEAVMQAKLEAHELLLVAHKATEPATASPAGDTIAKSCSALQRLSPSLFLSREPLLSPAEWSRQVTAVASVMRLDRQQKGAECVVEWWSLAPVPMCCVGDTPVAVVGRWDAQLVDGVPAHDCFVPRVRTVAVDRLLAEVSETAQMGAAAPAAAAAVPSSLSEAPQAMSFVREWTNGTLADAEDAALARHAESLIATDGYLEGYRASQPRGFAGGSNGAFTYIPQNAVLTKYAAATVTRGGGGGGKTLSHTLPALEDSAQVDDEGGSMQLGDSLSARRRSIERRGGGWERVMEAVAQEAPSRRISTRHSSSTKSPRAKLSAGSWGNQVSPQQSTSNAASVSPTDSQEGAHTFEGKGALLHLRDGEEGGETVIPSVPHHSRRGHAAVTVRQVAEEVSTSIPAEVVLHHTRRGLRFLPGWEGAKQMDSFVDMVTEAIVGGSRSGSPCVVLALDVVAQSFFALAAVLVDRRLRNARETPVAKAKEPLSIETDEHLRFLLSYHEVLASSLVGAERGESAGGAPSAHIDSVQLAVVHVADVVQATATSASPQLNVLARLQRALRDAEAASSSPSPPGEVQRGILLTAQLAEQYAWLVLLEWYLWSPHFSPSTATAKSTGFVQLWHRLADVQTWMQFLDPWAAAPERCPDPWHLHYSNGLRRWEDKHYVCFGAT